MTKKNGFNEQKPGTDNIYASPKSEINRFSFDDTVVDVFADMIERSVPGYSKIIQMIETIAQRQTAELLSQTPQPTAIECYDLGCSLGASALAMRRGIATVASATPDFVIPTLVTGIDNSTAMIERCQAYVNQDTTPGKVIIRQEDIEETPISNAMMVTLNFTLQFIPVDKRLSLLQNIHSGMNSNGILVLSEKVHFDSPTQQKILEELHWDFKAANGYSEMEISQKRTALENVLLPETIDDHKQRLAQAGFSTAEVWFQCFNFVSLIAHK